VFNLAATCTHGQKWCNRSSAAVLVAAAAARLAEQAEQQIRRRGARADVVEHDCRVGAEERVRLRLTQQRLVREHFDLRHALQTRSRCDFCGSSCLALWSLVSALGTGVNWVVKHVSAAPWQKLQHPASRHVLLEKDS
jgi:hypothetical protein